MADVLNIASSLHHMSIIAQRSNNFGSHVAVSLFTRRVRCFRRKFLCSVCTRVGFLQMHLHPLTQFKDVHICDWRMRGISTTRYPKREYRRSWRMSAQLWTRTKKAYKIVECLLNIAERKKTNELWRVQVLLHWSKPNPTFERVILLQNTEKKKNTRKKF